MQKLKSKKLIIFTLLILFGAAGFFIYSLNNSNDETITPRFEEAAIKQNPQNNSLNTDDATPNAGIDAESSNTVTDKNSPSLDQDPESPTTVETSGGLKVTEVVLTDAGQYGNEVEVRAFMPSIVDSGTCSITFEKDGESFTVDENAYPDATTTICTNTMITIDQFKTPGDWSVFVSYESETYSGISPKRTIEIQ